MLCKGIERKRHDTTARQLSFFRDNMLMNDNVLWNAHQYQTKKLISCLSTCVYPDVIEYPLTEQNIHLGLPHESNFGYAQAKRMVDVQNRCVDREPQGVQTQN